MEEKKCLAVTDIIASAYVTHVFFQETLDSMAGKAYIGDFDQGKITAATIYMLVSGISNTLRDSDPRAIFDLVLLVYVSNGENNNTAHLLEEKS